MAEVRIGGSAFKNDYEAVMNYITRFPLTQIADIKCLLRNARDNCGNALQNWIWRVGKGFWCVCVCVCGVGCAEDAENCRCGACVNRH